MERVDKNSLLSYIMKYTILRKDKYPMSKKKSQRQ